MMVDMKIKMSWYSARTYCKELNADLAIFKDANMYEETIHYINYMSKYFQNIVDFSPFFAITLR